MQGNVYVRLRFVLQPQRECVLCDPDDSVTRRVGRLESQAPPDRVRVRPQRVNHGAVHQGGLLTARTAEILAAQDPRPTGGEKPRRHRAVERSPFPIDAFRKDGRKLNPPLRTHRRVRDALDTRHRCKPFLEGDQLVRDGGTSRRIIPLGDRGERQLVDRKTDVASLHVMQALHKERGTYQQDHRQGRLGRH
jgi:hypothetical protein